MLKRIIVLSVGLTVIAMATTMTTGDIKEDYDVIQIVYGYSKGNIRGYVIKDALATIEKEADDLGADMVIGVRMEMISPYSEEEKTQILIYGTAIKLKKEVERDATYIKRER